MGAKSRLRVKSKQVVSREPVEGREHATCVLGAQSKQGVCQGPAEGEEPAICEPRAAQGSKAIKICAKSLLKFESNVPVSCKQASCALLEPGVC